MSDPAKRKQVLEAALKQTKVASDPTPPIQPTPPGTPPPPVEPPAPPATPTPEPPAAQATPPAQVEPPPVAPKQEDFVPDFLVTPPEPPPVQAAPPAPPAPESNSDKERNFANLRKAKDAAEQRLAQIFEPDGKVKADFIKSLKIEVPETQQLAKERDEALDRLAKYDLTADPRWRAKYAPAENAASAAILRFAQEYEVKPEAIQTAMQMPLRERTRWFQENMPDAVPMVAPHLATLDSIRLQKEQDIANAREVSKGIETQTTQEREQKVAQIRSALHQKVTRELGQSGVYVFNKRPGDEKWNQGVEQVEHAFAELLQTNDVNTHARAMALGAAAPVMLEHLKQANAMIRELRKQVQLHAGAGASIQTGVGQSSSGPANLSGKSPKDLARMAIEEAARRKSQKMT